MQFTTVAVFFAALLATTSAAPAVEERATCNFGQYACASNFNGVVQCGYDKNGKLALLKIGDCPKNTHCGLIGVVPYCLAN
ncbi:hypothetical protein F5884DRAFT_854260 [Xylogone sp. PMI_703]|nr:hypothetical protein F5884DRAFT_854260 [Xylogone sp. PMI_703]